MTPSPVRTAGRIFISYRRDETGFPASWLYERLATHFGPEQVFKDVDSIELGDDFLQAIANAVGACDVLLVLIGSQWLTITDEAGRRRLENSDDFVRLEIEAALQRRVRIIPILVGRARMPHADQLPASLAKLVHRQALELDPNRFETDSGRLLRVVERTLAEEESRRKAEAQRAEEASRLATVQTMAASLRADDVAEANAAEAALRRLAGDDSERVAQAAQAVLHVWKDEQDRQQREAEQRREAEQQTVQADEQRQPQGWPKEAPRIVAPPAKVVASVPPVGATDGSLTTVPIELPAPAPPGDTPAGVRPARRRLLIAGLALVGLLGAGGIAYAQFGGNGDAEVVGSGASPSASTKPTAASAATPADEVCTKEIQSNKRWVCLDSAVIANGKLTVNYKVDYAGSTPDIDTGFHVHFYGSDGKNPPPDYTMGSQEPMSTRGDYYYDYRQPMVLSTDSKDFRRVFTGAKKVCARIAVAGHGLVHDNKHGYQTGNCVPITKP